jgi:hypothetical protein
MRRRTFETGVPARASHGRAKREELRADLGDPSFASDRVRVEKQFHPCLGAIEAADCNSKTEISAPSGP